MLVYMPLLEYSVPVWQHYAVVRIQERACRIMLGTTCSHYSEALISCNIPELKLHRDKICLDFAKKLYSSTEFRKWLPKLRSEATGLVKLTKWPLQSHVQTGTFKAPSNSWLVYAIMRIRKFWLLACLYCSWVDVWCVWIPFLLTTLVMFLCAIYFEG